MFQFLQNIFSISEKRGTPYPEELVQAAIERAIDGTEPRLRILPGYAKQLRPAILKTIDHVVALVEALQDPVPATAEAREQHPTLAAVFTGAPRMGEILSRDRSLRDWREAGGLKADLPAVALLLVECHHKRGFGYGLVNDQLVADLPQTVVSFDEHRLVDITSDEQETRRLLRHRAFDYLLSRALAAVTERKEERADLSQRRAMLRCKLDVLQHNGGFSQSESRQSPAELQATLDDIEQKLAAMGSDDTVLPQHLALVCEVLGSPDKHLWLTETTLRLDAHYVLQESAESTVPAVTFQQLHDSAGREMMLLLLSIPPG